MLRLKAATAFILAASSLWLSPAASARTCETVPLENGWYVTVCVDAGPPPVTPVWATVYAPPVDQFKAYVSIEEDHVDVCFSRSGVIECTSIPPSEVTDLLGS